MLEWAVALAVYVLNSFCSGEVRDVDGAASGIAEEMHVY